MQPVQIKQGGKSVNIVLDQTLDIARVARVQAALVKAFAPGLPLRLDASRVERIDTAAMQLLAAFAREAQARALPLDCTRRSLAFDTALRLLGLSPLLGAGA